VQGVPLLLTNDDGVDAPGLAALLQAVAGFDPPHVVAPRLPESGASHAMSDRSPLRVAPHPLPGTRSAHAVDGRPADCVRLGLCHYAKDSAWVLSGINAGGNLGVDVYYSGTVGAAREAAILGRPAIAISQYIRDAATLDWQRSARWAAHVIRQILALPVESGLFWYVNLPQPDAGRPLTGLVVAPLAVESHHVDYQRREEPEAVSVFHYRGRYQDRPRPAGSDVDVVFAGGISVTPMGLDTAAPGAHRWRFTAPDDDGDRGAAP
jgi:5'-nucleotidase